MTLIETDLKVSGEVTIFEQQIIYLPFKSYEMTSAIHKLTYQQKFQKILNYAGPVLVSIETIRTIHSNKVWYYVLETTRILIAHCSIMTSEKPFILSIIAQNLRNLYRLFGIDLSERRKWSTCKFDVMCYGIPNPGGKIHLPLDDENALVAKLTQTVYSTVLNEFNNDNDNDGMKEYVGRCIYTLVATRKPSWMVSMADYAKNDLL